MSVRERVAAAAARHAKRLSAPGGADKQIQSRLCFISCSRRLNCEIKVNRERIFITWGKYLLNNGVICEFATLCGGGGGDGAWGGVVKGGVSLNDIFGGGSRGGSSSGWRARKLRVFLTQRLLSDA